MRLRVRLTPKAGRDAVEGIKSTADGGCELAVKVTAVPEKGRANEALLRLLAKQLHVAPNRLSLVAGATDRHKQVAFTGAPEDWLPTLRAWLAPHGLVET
ncbi:DUF167 family protein [Ferrovibrio sp.]|uniref:DUF167 family protein n=1 Tax=Ferrovibrio sp. TaxID=1917215 RepID=UPI0035B17DF4